MDHSDRGLAHQLLKALVSPTEDGRAPFRLYRRKTRRTERGKPVFIYYCQFYDSARRRYATACTTHQTSRAAALTWAASRLAESHYKSVRFDAFAAGLFDPGSEYLVYREQRGRPMSWNHRKHCATYLRKYVIPFFQGWNLDDIDTLDIERFQSWLLEQPVGRNCDRNLSPSTVNHVVQALHLLTKWAIHQRLIKTDPFVGVESLATQPKRRGIFSLEEVQRIFDLGEDGWPDPLARILNGIAAACGLRKGELQALRRCDLTERILPDGRRLGLLRIEHSWERSGRLKGTKTERIRFTPLPPGLYLQLLAVMNASPWQETHHFIFCSVDPNKPMSHHKIDRDFERAVRAAGISDEERRARNLSFHSWRHWANSFLVNAGLPPLRAQQVIGHTSLKMTENYLHPGEDFSDVLAITASLFDAET